MMDELELSRRALLSITVYLACEGEDIVLPKNIEDDIDAWMKVYKKEKCTFKGVSQCQREKVTTTEG